MILCLFCVGISVDITARVEPDIYGPKLCIERLIDQMRLFADLGICFGLSLTCPLASSLICG